MQALAAICKPVLKPGPPTELNGGLKMDVEAYQLNHRAIREAALREAAEAVRVACGPCDRSGHASAEEQCPYCGYPIGAILALIDKEPTDEA